MNKTIIGFYLFLECSNKTSIILNGKEYRMFFYSATSFEAKESCQSWGKQWKSYAGDLMQDIDDSLQDCLKHMIESAKHQYFRDNIGGFFLGGQIVNNLKEKLIEWHWHNGHKIEVNETTKQPVELFFEVEMLPKFIVKNVVAFKISSNF